VAVEEVVLFDAVPPPPGHRLDALLADPRVRTVIGDVADAALLASLVAPDALSVFHLAGVMSGQGEADFDLALRVNFFGTHALLEACRARGTAPRVVFASTIAAFGATDGTPAGDDTKLRPLNTYGMTKALCELLINDMTRKGFIDGRVARLPTVVVRPGLPNAATTSCFSGIVREPLAGVDVTMPVAGDLPHAVVGHRACVAALLALHDVPLDTLAAVCGSDRCVTLPAISTTLRSLADAAARAATRRGLRLGAIAFAPDPFLGRMVGSMAAGTEASRARALGLPDCPGEDDLVEQYLEDFGVAGSGLYQAPAPAPA
jgi:nucleoside-diphosphate-sugar epimerase